MEEGWFRWVMGGLVAAYSAVTGFLISIWLHDRRKLAELTTRVAVLENKPYVDPIEHERTITEFRLAIERLLEQAVEATEARKEQRDLLQRILTVVSVKRELTR